MPMIDSKEHNPFTKYSPIVVALLVGGLIGFPVALLVDPRNYPLIVVGAARRKGRWPVLSSTRSVPDYVAGE